MLAWQCDACGSVKPFHDEPPVVTASIHGKECHFCGDACFWKVANPAGIPMVSRYNFRYRRTHDGIRWNGWGRPIIRLVRSDGIHENVTPRQLQRIMDAGLLDR